MMAAAIMATMHLMLKHTLFCSHTHTHIDKVIWIGVHAGV